MMTTPINAHAGDMTGYQDDDTPVPDVTWQTIIATGNAVVRACARAKMAKGCMAEARARFFEHRIPVPDNRRSAVHFALIEVRQQLACHRLAWKAHRLVEDLRMIARISED